VDDKTTSCSSSASNTLHDITLKTRKHISQSKKKLSFIGSCGPTYFSTRTRQKRNFWTQTRLRPDKKEKVGSGPDKNYISGPGPDKNETSGFGPDKNETSGPRPGFQRIRSSLIFYLLNKRGLTVRLANGESQCPAILDESTVKF
jgi:hypothetical protein